MPTPIPNIWQMQSRGEVDALIDALRHSEATVRKGAAAALRALGAWQAVPALEAALAVEHDWQAHAAITAALQYLDRDIHIETMVKSKDIRGLTKMLNSRRVEDILTACEALGTIGDRNAAEGLVMVFRNPLLPNNARLAAAEALLKLESAPAVVTLLGALRRDNWQVRRNAAAVLGQLQAGWATVPLIAALKDQNVTVRRTAAAALRRINSPEAIAAAAVFEETQKKSTQELEPPEPPPSVVSPTAQQATQLTVQPTVETASTPAPAAVVETSGSADVPKQDGSASPVAEPVKPAYDSKPAEVEQAASVTPPSPASGSRLGKLRSTQEMLAASTNPSGAAPTPEETVRTELQAPSPVEPPAAVAPHASFADALPTPAVFRKGATGPLTPHQGTQSPADTPNNKPDVVPAEPPTATSSDTSQPNAAEKVMPETPETMEKPTSSTESQGQQSSGENSGNSQPG